MPPARCWGRTYAARQQSEFVGIIGRQIGLPHGETWTRANWSFRRTVCMPRTACKVGSGSHARGSTSARARRCKGSATQAPGSRRICSMFPRSYGQEMVFCVAFVEKLRDEQKFSSTDALQKQIQSDIEAARRMF